MVHPQSNSSLFLSYGVYGDSADFSRNYDSPYMISASNSTAFMVDQAAPSHIPSDLPDLYYDQELSTPPSATSSNVISTPPPDWPTPWQQTESNYSPNNPSFPTPSWPFISCQGGRPTIAPIDTNVVWKGRQACEEPSVHFAPSEGFDMRQKLHPYHSSYPQAYSYTQANASFEQPPSSSMLSSYHSSPMVSPPAPPNSSPVSSSDLSPSRPALKLHQPRPSRRIPIISLSKLASACDTLPLQTSPDEPRSKFSGSIEVTSLRSSGSSSMLQSPRTISQDRSIWIRPLSLHPTNSAYTPWGTPGDQGKVLSCTCGCQESYIFT